MLVQRFYAPYPGMVARFESWAEVALELTRFAYDGSVSFEVAAWVAEHLTGGVSLNPLGDIFAAYLHLPTHYVADGRDDFWQNVRYTLEVKVGDCEDSTTTLTAILGKRGIDARVAVIPKHAAVVIPVEVDGWGRRSIAGWELPADWLTFAYEGRIWLGLETTLAVRRVPGEATQKLREAAAMGQLWIGPPLQAVGLLLKLRAVADSLNWSLTKTGRRRRRQGF